MCMTMSIYIYAHVYMYVHLIYIRMYMYDIQFNSWSHMVLYHCEEESTTLPKAGSFRYSECFALGYSFIVSLLIAFVCVVFVRPVGWVFACVSRTALVQWLLDSWADKLSGIGYSPDGDGYMEATVKGITAPDELGDTHNVTCKIKIRGDPGYRETATMAVECAISMAVDIAKCPPTAGVLTPAAALSDAIVNRLNAKDRVSFSIT
eukprot:GHVQ01007475.1.p1 GENE.GHVQ01007475.1~~GHVQ01007475.1.p1  ORF type:complete len:206 (+),score=18.89 GHVQ01007475.1:208-825(+)